MPLQTTFQRIRKICIPSILSFVCLFLFQSIRAQSTGLFTERKKNDSNFSEKLLNAGADSNAIDADGDDALMIAAHYSSETCMNLLLQKGTNPNKTNPAGETPLMWSVHALPKTKLLLKFGADVHAKSHSGNTPLLIAAMGSRN